MRRKAMKNIESKQEEVQKRLIIPIYLNQKIVFDMIAIIEDGFSQMRSVQKLDSDNSNSSATVSGELGTSNVFSLLSIGLKSGFNKNISKNHKRTFSEDRIHTPTSLFSKLLDYLYEKKMIKEVDENSFSELTEGDFVHFKGVLEKNPIINSIESIENLMMTFLPFVNEENRNTNGKKNKQNSKYNENVTILNQIKSLAEGLKSNNIIDIICHIGNSKSVLQTDLDFFNNRSMNEIIDGKYDVIGKVIKINTEFDSSINLLRNTNLSAINEKLMDVLNDSFQTDEMSSSGIDIPRITTLIKGDSILVLPIAIYS